MYCDKCDDKERIRKISCTLCTAPKSNEMQKIDDINRTATKEDAEAIDNAIEKNHKEAIDGYDNQLVDNLRGLATFITKMLIMFEDYKKKGNIAEMTELLESIKHYAMLSETNSAVVVTTTNMLLDKMHGTQ